MHFAGSNPATDRKTPKCIYKNSKSIRVEKTGEISRKLPFSQPIAQWKFPDIRLWRRFARPAPCKRACRTSGDECEPTHLRRAQMPGGMREPPQPIQRAPGWVAFFRNRLWWTGYSPAAKIPLPAAGECEPTHLRRTQMPGGMGEPPQPAQKAPIRVPFVLCLQVNSDAEFVSANSDAPRRNTSPLVKQGLARDRDLPGLQNHAGKRVLCNYF